MSPREADRSQVVNIHPGRLRAEWWLVLAISGLLLCFCVATGATDRLDYLLYDLFQRHHERAPHGDVLIVGVDDRSLAEVGAWPWPRATQAKLLQQLGQAHPRAIGLDVLLLERGDPATDRALADALRAAGPTYLPVQFQVPGPNGAGFAVQQPPSPIREGAAALGHVNLGPDSDGIVRRYWLTYSGGGRSWPALSSLVAGVAKGSPSATPGPVMAPLTASQPVMIDFVGAAGSFPTISAGSLLRGEVPPELLANRIVLIGITASGLGDMHSTPMGGDGSLMPGIEIQANLVDTLLSHRQIVPAHGAVPYGFAVLPLALLLLGLRLLPPRWTLAAIAGLALAVLAVSAGLLRLGQIWLPPVTALLGLALAYPLWSWRKLAVASRYMSGELERSLAEGLLFEQKAPKFPARDFLDRQMALLHHAIGRERDLRRFLNDRLAQMPDAMLVTDLEGRIIIANDRARQLAGELALTTPLQRAGDLTGLLHHNDEPLPDFAAIALTRLAWQDQAESATGRSFDIRFEPQRTADDVPVGYVLRIAETTEMTAMQRAREDVLELLSHDMRSPQSSIIHLLDGKDGAGIEPGLAARIKGYARSTLKLADDFVHLSRAQMAAFAPEEVDLGELAWNAADALWPQAQAKEMTIDVSTPNAETEHDMALVMGEASDLARMLGNLIDNAVKYGDQGSAVEVAVTREAKAGQVTISNHGAVIAPEQLANLFERFRRAASGPAKAVDGVGLGLSFVHTVILRHGGTITCESSEQRDGRGLTCFTVRIPLVAAFSEPSGDTA